MTNVVKVSEDYVINAHNISMNVLEDGMATVNGGRIITDNTLIRFNPNHIAADVTIPSNYNGFSTGPMTINNGITVTIPAGSAWSIA